MAAAKKQSKPSPKKTESLEKIANLLALLLVRDAKQGDAIVQLSRVGFSDDEIAELVRASIGTIRQTRYLANKKKPT